MPVYLDLVVLLNFLVDFLLILGTNRLSGFPMQPARSAAAALVGAVYSGVCLLPGLRFLMNPLWRVVSLVIMGVAAFGWDRSSLKRGGLFVLLSMAMGGIALGLSGGSVLGLVLCAGGIWVLCAVSFGGRVGQREYVPLRIDYGDRSVSLIALRDTGNTLRDPITGEQVLVIGAEAARQLTGLTPQQLASPMETMTRHPLPGLRMIPYRAVGQGAGMLLAMRFRDVQIGSRRGEAMVAFAPEAVGKGDCYQALTGGAV